MPDSDHEEIERLRDWRHETVTPELAAMRGTLRDLLRRMDKVEPKVERMAKAAEIADAVADKLHERSGQMFSRTQKTGALLVGLATLATALHSWGIG